ncbi:hypothetical protein Pan54_09440 [Rubinisphaera italica]|uniref:Uncharacterized protein n=1 Tax=Rubinisphaera italica TaxID=2527969 RepID=A0A5C5XB58_9PLAN|nr:hypothetical protein Pan54_09440 [Rubinisphaera italica]
MLLLTVIIRIEVLLFFRGHLQVLPDGISHQLLVLPVKPSLFVIVIVMVSTDVERPMNYRFVTLIVLGK